MNAIKEYWLKRRALENKVEKLPDFPNGGPYTPMEAWKKESLYWEARCRLAISALQLLALGDGPEGHYASRQLNIIGRLQEKDH